MATRYKRIHRVDAGSTTSGPVAPPIAAINPPVVYQAIPPVLVQHSAVSPTSTVQSAPSAVQGVVFDAENPTGIDLPPIDETHPGFIRNSPSGQLREAGGGGYQTIQFDGVALPQETTLNFSGVGVDVTDGVDKTNVTFAEVVPETATLSHSPSILQIGASLVNPAFTASYASAPDTAILTDTEGNTDDVSSTPTAFVAPHTYLKSVYGQSVTWTISVTSPDGDATASTSVTWTQKVFWGAIVDPGVYNSAFIAALSNSNLQVGPSGTFAVNATGGKSTFYATRTAFGVTAANFTVGAFPFAVSKVAAAVAYTNTNGVTETYDVWRSDNIDLGAFSFVEA